MNMTIAVLLHSATHE